MPSRAAAECQTACKPGSVREPELPGWPFIWDPRCRAPQATYPGGGAGDRPGQASRAAPIRSCSRWGLPCRSRCRSRGALLPHPFTLARASRAVCFLWHFPWGRPRRALPGTVSPWSPDFPPPPAPVGARPAGARGGSGHPAVWRRTYRRPRACRRAARQPQPARASTLASACRVDLSAQPSTRAGLQWR